MPVPNLKIGSWKVDKGLKLAIEAAGSARRLAAKLGVSQQAVQQWQRIPAERVIEVERVTMVPREAHRLSVYLVRGMLSGRSPRPSGPLGQKFRVGVVTGDSLYSGRIGSSQKRSRSRNP